MKILVIAGRYGLSGVPLAQLKLAKALARDDHHVELIYGAVNEGNKLPESNLFKISTLNSKRVSSMLFPLAKYFIFKKPDLVFTAGDHLNAIVLIASIISISFAKISCSSRVTPYDTYSSKIFSKGWLLKIVMSLVDWRANALTCVSKEMVEQYHSTFAHKRHKCVYNIVLDEESKNIMSKKVHEEWLNNKSGQILIAAGALEPWKGFDDLINAFNLVKLENKNIKLLILGDGSMRLKLKQQISELNLENYVKLLGFKNDPIRYFSLSDIFVLSSHVEGMPNVLIEAMMAGCTPVSTECPTGPKEIISENENGYLAKVKDSRSIANAIIKALDKPIEKNKLKDAVKQFHEKIILEKHFHMLGLKDV